MSCYWWLWLVLFVRQTPFHSCDKKGQDGVGMYNLSEDVEFSVIKTIHNQLDDNADGRVDAKESKEFVETELCGVPGETVDEAETKCRDPEKSLKFHKMDMEITSAELWITWHHNEVFNWTNKDVLDWLEHCVELPQYANTFREHQITGRQLPYIAINYGQILQSMLLITDSQHKQKIQLRAMDVVLFGPPVQPSQWKDTIVIISIILCTCGIIYALRQRKISKAHIDKFIADLKLKEEEVKRLKSKFEELESLGEEEAIDGPNPIIMNSSNQEGVTQEDSPPIMISPSNVSSSDEESTYCRSCCSTQDSDSVISRAKAGSELLQLKVWSMEEELEMKNRMFQMLQELLPECQQKEREQLEFRKSTGEEELVRAQRVCEKIKKRRSSLFGTLHLANSSTLEEAGLQITKAVNKMQLISKCFEDHHKRWNKIGHICGFHVSSPTSLNSHGSVHTQKSPPISQHSSVSSYSQLRSSPLHHSQRPLDFRYPPAEGLYYRNHRHYSVPAALATVMSSSSLGKISHPPPPSLQTPETIGNKLTDSEKHSSGKDSATINRTATASDSALSSSTSTTCSYRSQQVVPGSDAASFKGLNEDDDEGSNVTTSLPASLSLSEGRGGRIKSDSCDDQEKKKKKSILWGKNSPVSSSLDSMEEGSEPSEKKQSSPRSLLIRNRRKKITSDV